MGVILVTGGSRGIGRGIVLELVGAGHRVAIHYNANKAAAEETARECTALHKTNTNANVPLTAIFKANIASPEDRQRLVSEVTGTFGEISGLVNNAGIAPRRRDDIIDAKEEIFDEVLKVNLYGPYFLTQLIARSWLKQAKQNSKRTTGGEPHRIIFVTSVSAEQASIDRGEYCISKAGLAMAAQLYAARLAADGIYVYEIRPGIIATDMTAGVKDKYDQSISEGLVPQKRWGTPADIGRIVKSIMNGELDFSTGSVIHADGGLHIAKL